MTTIKHPFVSFTLVGLQFALIIILLLNLSFTTNSAALLIQAIAVIIGLWAVKAMHFVHFNIVPDPKEDGELVTDGPYSLIRHPMYFSILLFFLPLVLLDFSGINLALYINLGLILFIKLSYEEHLLTEQLAEYSEYQQKTKKLIPFVL